MVEYEDKNKCPNRSDIWSCNCYSQFQYFQFIILQLDIPIPQYLVAL